MRAGGRGRLAWLLVTGLAVVVAAFWFLASGPRSEGAAHAPLSADRSAPDETPPVLPRPAEPVPLVADAGGPAHQVAETPQAAVAAPPEAAAAKPVAVLRVLVFDPHGAALPGAEVVCPKAEPRRQLTDAQGIARLTASPGELVKAAARHPDFRLAVGSATLGADAGSVTDLTLQLTEGLQVCVEVQARDGRPIGSAQVRFKEMEEFDADQSRVGSPEELQAAEDGNHIRGDYEETRTTDAQGRCCVQGVASGSLSLCVDAAGYVPIIGRKFKVGADGGDLGVIVLDPALKVRGIVEDAAGVVPGALVEARLGVTGSRPKRGDHESFDQVYRRTTTAEDGSFEIDGARKFPAYSSLRVLHPTRGRFHVESMTFTEQPGRIVLVPDLFATFVLSDAQTGEAIEGEAKLDVLFPWNAGFLFFESFASSSHRTGRVEAGRVEVAGLPYYLETLRLTVPGYDPVDVPAKTLADEADHVLEYALTRPVPLVVRVHAAGSGDLLPNARLHLGQKFVHPKDRVTWSGRLLEAAHFDPEAGGFLVTEADLCIPSGDEITLSADAKGYAHSKTIPIASNGQRTCALTIDLYLEPE